MSVRGRGNDSYLVLSYKGRNQIAGQRVSVGVSVGVGLAVSPVLLFLSPLQAPTPSLHSTFSLTLTAMLHLSALAPILCSQKSGFCSSLTPRSGKDEELLFLPHTPWLGRVLCACVVLHVSVGVALTTRCSKAGACLFGVASVCVCVCVQGFVSATG